MSTVGKMIAEGVNTHLSQWTRSVPGDLIAVLRKLGIWDAEVLEGHQYGEKIILDTVVPVTTPLDRPVRVIVLPKGA